MREIKFRAWDKKNKRMIIEGIDLEMFCLSLGDSAGNSCPSPFGHPACADENRKEINVIPKECPYLDLMQYTGLKDKNGVEIYEGDIVIAYEYHPEVVGSCPFEDKGIIIYNNIHGGYYLEVNEESATPLMMPDALEVIGNIYENPELLEEK